MQPLVHHPMTHCPPCRRLKQHPTKLEEFCAWYAVFQETRRQQTGAAASCAAVMDMHEMYQTLGGRPAPDLQEHIDELREEVAGFPKVQQSCQNRPGQQGLCNCVPPGHGQ